MKKISHWKRFRFQLEAVAVGCVAVAVRCLPRAGAYRLGLWLGGVAHQFAKKDQRIARANLDLAFGTTKTAAEKQRIARIAFQNTVGTLVALFWSPRLNAGNFRRYIEIAPEALAQLTKAQAENHGVIFLTLHYGDWELLGLAFGFLGFKSTIVAKPLRNAAMDQRFVKLRSGSGHQIIPQRNAARPLLSALRSGQNIALLSDLNARRDTGGVWVDLFGLPVFRNVAAAALSLHTGAPILLCSNEPIGNGRIRVHVHRIEFEPTGNPEEDAQRLSQRCFAAAEAVIRARPEFWLWHYRHWRHRPGPGHNNYPFYAENEPPS